MCVISLVGLKVTWTKNPKYQKYLVPWMKKEHGEGPFFIKEVYPPYPARNMFFVLRREDGSVVSDNSGKKIYFHADRLDIIF